MSATANDIRKRQQCERRRAALELERSSFMAHWRELSEYILPRRSRFNTFDTNRGEKRNQKIIDSTATESAGVLSAGMMSGVTNPTQPWFELTVADPALAKSPPVKAWLYSVQKGMETVFVRSNIYNKFPVLYKDAGVFGTGAIGVFEDQEQVIRVSDFPLGSYCIGLDEKGRVRIFSRVFRLTVEQVVERWGRLDAKTGRADFEDGLPTNLSITVQSAWKIGNREQWVDLVHLIQPNNAYDGVKIESRFKRFESLYYEKSATGEGFLEHSGYDEFPILAARWETSGEDVYGTTCPGMQALGDIKQLQFMEKKVAQAVEKQLNPPLKGPAELRNQRVSSLPGDITYTNERDGVQGLKPIYEVNFNIADAEQKSQQLRDRIRRSFKEDLFLMLAQSDRRDITAREVEEKHEEKFLALGPTFGQLTEDVLDPLIERTYAIMSRAGLIPDPPQELDGAVVTVKYVSIVAQAMAQVALAALDRFAGAVGQVSQYIPEALDRFNTDEWVGQYAEASGVPPTVLRSAEEAQQRRDARAQAQSQAQGVDNFSKVAGAARDLGNAPVEGNGALAKLVAGMRAKGTISAAQTPVQGAQ